MKGIVRKFELKEIKTKDNKKFKKLEFTCDVMLNDKGDIKTLKGDMSEEYARKYFAFCKKTTKDVLGEEVEVNTAKRSYINSDGEQRIYTYIKYLNLLDEEGKPIIMLKDDAEEIDF